MTAMSENEVEYNMDRGMRRMIARILKPSETSTGRKVNGNTNNEHTIHP